MAYSAHAREDNHSSFYPRAPVSNSRHASPEVELEEHSFGKEKRETPSAFSEGHATSSSGGEATAGEPRAASLSSANTATVTAAVGTYYDGISPFFGNSGLASAPTRRFPSPYGTPTGSSSGSAYYPGLALNSSLQGAASRAAYSQYMQQQPGAALSQQPSYLQESAQSHSTAIAPSYLQSHQHAGPSSAPMNVHPLSFVNGASPTSFPTVHSASGNGGNMFANAVDAALDEIEDEDENDDTGNESSDDNLSSYGDDTSFRDGVSNSNNRKRRRKLGSTQGQKGNGISDGTLAKRAKAEEMVNGNKSGRKGKTKNESAFKDDSDSKSKSTRGSKACTVCRRLKMRCEPSPDGDQSKCKRCRAGGHECIFEESQRGRRKNQKTDAMAKSIKNMENTLETVLKAIATGNAHTVVGMSLGSDGNLVAPAENTQTQVAGTSSTTLPEQQISLPPLPMPGSEQSSVNGYYASSSAANANATQTTGERENSTIATAESLNKPAPVPSPVFALKADENLGPSGNGQGSSPALRLHSLPEPENTWAPLGLLAEASLENNQSRRRRNTFAEDDLPNNLSALDEIKQARSREAEDRRGDGSKLGVANDAYFQPGPFNSMSESV